MRLAQLINKGSLKLKAAGISSARLDVLILLEDIMHKDRAWILAHPEHELNIVQARRLERKFEKRALHTPLAYIRGHTEFYGRKFKVNRHVLEPRPESEIMIELLKKLKLPPSPAIADIGTGNGAIGITAAIEIQNSKVDLYDISAGAIAVAKHNIHLHELSLHVRKMNLLGRPLRPYDVFSLLER
jgi:release factor glutamine methyltransferase